MGKAKRSAFFFLLGMLAPSLAYAQSTTTGAIQGTVRDGASGKPLDGVTIVATSPSLQGSQSELSDDDGAYYLANLPLGTYELVFYYADLKLRRQNVTVTLGATTPLNVTMNTAAGSQKEVTVRVRSSTIDISNTKQGTTLTKDYTNNVPSRGRTYDSVLGAAAGSQQDDLGVAFSGSGSVENNYVVDGMNTTGLTYGDVGSPLLNDFIQEIEVITGGYNAEFGRSTGGVVNVVTKSGGNTFHGTLWGNARPFEAAQERIFTAGSVLDARSTLAYDVDFGFDLGGPLVKDRIWFYVGFAPQLEGATITRLVGTRVDRRRNDVQYPRGTDGALADGDGDPATDPNPGCERAGNCESDGRPDVDPASGFERLEELERRDFADHAATWAFIGKLNVAASEDHQGQLSIIGSPWRGRDIGVVGTPAATQADKAGLTLDTSAKWSSKFAGNKLELDAVVGWHHATLAIRPHDAALVDVPQIAAAESDLGAIGRNPDQPESRDVLQFCTEGDPAIRDEFPTIVNCPVTEYGFGSLGAFTDTREDRYAGALSATWRVKLAGHHKLKVGADVEDNFLTDRSGFTGGRQFMLHEGQWRIFTYARKDPAGPDTCGFEEDGATPVACNQLGEPGDPFGRSTETFNWAGYIQDTWQLLPNLTVNAGLRYEEQRLKTAREIRGTLDTVTGETLGADALSLDFLLAPRLGAVYDWTQEGRSRVYGNWGRFYESIPMDINNHAFAGEAFYEAFYDATDPAVNGCQPWTDVAGGPDFTPRLPSDPRTCDTSTMPVYDSFLNSGNDAIGLPPGIAALVMPGLKSQYLDEIVMGLEYEPISDLRLGLSFQHRRLGRVVEDVSTDGTNTYIIANPGEFDQGEAERLQAQVDAETDPAKQAALQARLDMFQRVNQFDKPRREYAAVQLTVLKRFSRQFFVQGSYTRSKSDGNYPGLYSPDNGQLDPNLTSQYDMVELLANRNGPLPQDRPHNVQLDGYYTFDLQAAGEVTVGLKLRAISGRPVSTLGAHPIYGRHEAFILPRGAWGRTDFQNSTDLRLQYARDLSAHTRVYVFFDLFNVFNQQTQIAVDEEYTQDNVNPIVGGTAADLNYLKAVDGDGLATPEVAQRLLNYANTAARQAPLAARFGVRLEF